MVTGVASLPQHLLTDIFELAQLTRDDLLALRLCCRFFNDTATPVVFRRVCISQLIRDRDHFFNICDQPHLAHHVREIEWQEVSWHPNFLESLQRDSARRALPEDDIIFVAPVIADIVEEVFWIPSVPFADADAPDVPDETWVEKRNQIVATFTPLFQNAVSKLPNLTTVISQPMSDDRIISYDSYPVTVANLCFNLGHRIPSKHTPPNDGLALFLIPAMIKSVTFNRLVWDTDFRLNCTEALTPCPEFFARLVTLDLSFASEKQEPDLANLSLNLKAAHNVRHLSISTDFRLKRWSKLYACLLRWSPEDESSGWSDLKSLSLVFSQYPKDTSIVLGTIRDNAKTLRYLNLQNCGICSSDLKQLAQFPELHLKSIRIHCDGNSHPQSLSEQLVLSFVNKTWSQPTDPSNDCYEGQLIETVVTQSDEDVDGWEVIVSLTDDDARTVCSTTDSQASDDSLDIRLRDAPYWAWCRSCGPSEDLDLELYYRLASVDTPGAFKTTIWRFTTHENKVAYGTDPLVFFGEWDEELGDVAEPTPYGQDLPGRAELRRIEISAKQDQSATNDPSPLDPVLLDLDEREVAQAYSQRAAQGY